MAIGLCHFPGIEVIESARMTIGQGVQPSVCTIVTVPHSSGVPAIGDLTWSFGDVVFTFKDCFLNRAPLSFDTDQGLRWRMQILDRRWRWKFNHISGHYNRRDPAGEVIKDSEKTPQELLKLLFAAMGEQNPDVERVPNNARPEVLWDYATPALELNSLCDTLNCRVILGLDNRAKVWPIGQGELLPTQNAQNVAVEAAFVQAPDVLKIVTAPIRYQDTWELEAVGLETDGTIKPIDDLSYKPDAGWGNPWSLAGIEGEFEDQEGLTRQYRDYAAQSVYRWYRAKQLTNGSFKPKDYDRDVPKREMLLPLINELNTTTTDPDGVKTQKPAEVRGVFWQGANNTAAGTEWHNLTFTNKSFSLDTQEGIVKFPEAVAKVDTTNATWVAPDLELICTFEIDTDQDTASKRRLEKERKLTNGTYIKPLRHDLIIPRRTVKDGQVTSNEDKLEPEFNYYFDQEQRALAPTPSGNISYGGLVPIELDGLRSQVSWSVGGRGAFTQASIIKEHNTNVLTYSQARRQEEVQQLANQEALERRLKLRKFGRRGATL